MGESKQEWVYRVLRQRILDGTYGPGMRLVARSLAQELGVSPIPVREALRRLEAEGLVETRLNVGATVAGVDRSAYVETMSVLAVLEGYATRLAASRLDSGDLERLEAYNLEMEAALAGMDLARFDRLNRAFHTYIYDRCGNGYLREVINQCWLRLDRIRHTIFIYIPHRGRASLAEHRAIVAAIRDGRPAAEVEELAREHKLRTLETFLAWEPGAAGADPGRPGAH